MTTCPNCKRRLSSRARFCEQCGTQISEAPLVGSHSAPTTNPVTAILSGISANTLKVIAVLLAIAVVLVVLLSSVFFAGSNNSFAYIKDDELFYSTVSKAKGKQVSTELLDGVNTIGNIGDYVRIDNNGKRLFYVDQYDGTGYDLYYKSTSKLSKAPVKIASDINVYDINDKGTLLTYIKDGGDLFQHDLKQQSDKIDEDVMSFVASDNGKSVIYLKMTENSDRYAVDVYLSKSGKSGEKIASFIEDINYLSDDFKSMYFTKDGSLYKMKIGREPELVSESVSNVIKIFDSGEAYFTKNADNAVTLYYYDGKNEPSFVSDSFYSAEDFAEDSPVLVYYSETITDDIPEYSFYIATEEKSYKLDNNISSIDISASGKQMYYIADIAPDTGAGELYKASVSKNGIKDPEKCNSDVYSGYYLSDNKYIYVKNYSSESSIGEVYMNNKKVADDVYWGYINYSDQSDTLAYYTDISESNHATLNIYKNNKSKKVLDEVYMYSLVFAPEGELLFLADFGTDDGTLFTAKGKHAKKVDIDVSAVVRIITNEEYDMQVLAGF